MLLFAILAIIAVCIWSAMADLPAATQVTRAGVSVAGATAGAAAQTFANDGSIYLLIQNDNVAATTATFPSTETVSDGVADLTVQDPTVSVPAGESKLCGPFKPSVFNDATGKVTCNLSVFADVTLKLYRTVNFHRGE